MIDKNTVFQVLSSLMVRPQYLSETEKYHLAPNDFFSPFERYVYAAIFNLYRNGAKTISIIDIDNYLSIYPEAKATFDKHNGVEVLQDALELVQVNNFDFYYKRLKKFNALTDLQKLGYDTSNIYCDDLTNIKAQEINSRFEEMTCEDIFNYFKHQIVKVESIYNSEKIDNASYADDGIDELIASFGVKPEVGARLQGTIFNTVCRGARKGKYYIRTASSGVGKTRAAVGDACMLSFPVRYNNDFKKWEWTGSDETTLFIATEQKKDEIQTLILAYLTGINEELILYGLFTEEEKAIINQARLIMHYYRKNFIIEEMPNPDIAQVKAIVRRKWIEDNIDNVFYDYIFSSPNLLAEFRDLKVREDVALGMMSAALKELAVEMNLFIMTSTQTNAKVEEEKGIKNEAVIRGARSIIDKGDFACICCRVTPEEEKLLVDICDEYIPNQVMDVYKNRRGRFTNVRIWSYVDLGTCRKKDLFITDANYNVINNYQTINFEFSNDSDIDRIIELLNGGEAETLFEEIEEKEEVIIEEIKEPEKVSNNNEGLFGGLL